MNGKRVQSNMGAKNHGVIMPDANKENTLTQLVGAAFGAAGQRLAVCHTSQHYILLNTRAYIPAKL